MVVWRNIALTGNAERKKTLLRSGKNWIYFRIWAGPIAGSNPATANLTINEVNKSKGN